MYVFIQKLGNIAFNIFLNYCKHLYKHFYIYMNIAFYE